MLILASSGRGYSVLRIHRFIFFKKSFNIVEKGEFNNMITFFSLIKLSIL